MQYTNNKDTSLFTFFNNIPVIFYLFITCKNKK
jgi:hypothetical protein